MDFALASKLRDIPLLLGEILDIENWRGESHVRLQKSQNVFVFFQGWKRPVMAAFIIITGLVFRWTSCSREGPFHCRKGWYELLQRGPYIIDISIHTRTAPEYETPRLPRQDEVDAQESQKFLIARLVKGPSLDLNMRCNWYGIWNYFDDEGCCCPEYHY